MKSCKFVMILTSSCCKSSIYKIAFYSGNVILSESGEKCSKIKHLLWIMGAYFGQKWQLKVKLPWWICLYKNTAFTQDVNRWPGIMRITCDVFISCLGSYFDGTHSLQRIQWWTCSVTINFLKSQSHEHLTFYIIFHKLYLYFNYSFNPNKNIKMI